jgi:hypothetical protein
VLSISICALYAGAILSAATAACVKDPNAALQGAGTGCSYIDAIFANSPNVTPLLNSGIEMPSWDQIGNAPAGTPASAGVAFLLTGPASAPGPSGPSFSLDGVFQATSNPGLPGGLDLLAMLAASAPGFALGEKSFTTFGSIFTLAGINNTGPVPGDSFSSFTAPVETTLLNHPGSIQPFVQGPPGGFALEVISQPEPAQYMMYGTGLIFLAILGRYMRKRP